MNSGINIIFYSKICNVCAQLLKILHNENMLGIFKLICVDDKIDTLPKSIKVVPTMIVSSINKPLEGKEIFEWINSRKFVKSQKNKNIENDDILGRSSLCGSAEGASTVQITEKLLLQDPKIIHSKPNNNTLGYTSQEMSGFSDNFAYTKIDIPQPHTFLNLEDENKYIIFTAPEQNKLSKNEQDERIRQIENIRKKQDELLKKNK